MKRYDAVTMGASAGGLVALTAILSALPQNFALPVIIVQHRSREKPSLLEEVMSNKCILPVKQADEKEVIEAGIIYFAPPDYHLLIELDGSFSLSVEAPLNYSRPSIDILFETAAAAYKNRLLAIILTGASRDGTEGIKTVKRMGGSTIAQDPAEADSPLMPQSAIETGMIDRILRLQQIKSFLMSQK